MTKTLLTGATGLVGYHIARALLQRGRRVRAAVRNVDKARLVVPSEVELVAADVCDAASIKSAMVGCDRVFHCAGLPEQWLADVGQFQRINVGGTRNVVAAALAQGVERFVYTSTIDVFAAARGAEYDETHIDDEPKPTHYERSKQDADRVVVAALAEGLPAVFTHPAAVYGPGPSSSPGLNQLIADLRDRKIPGLLPGGMPVVYGPDLAEGHLLVEAREPGSRYILAEQYYSLQEIAAVVAEQCDGKVPITLPSWVASLISVCGEGLATIRKKPPLIPRGQLLFLRWQARPQNRLAREELGWTVTPLAQGVKETLSYLQDSGR